MRIGMMMVVTMIKRMRFLPHFRGRGKSDYIGEIVQGQGVHDRIKTRCVSVRRRNGAEKRQSKHHVLVSGWGTNLQSFIDGIESGLIRMRKSCGDFQQPKRYSLERARKHGIGSPVIGKSNYPDMIEGRNQIIAALDEVKTDLVVLAGS
jgi:hypothetical protein